MAIYLSGCATSYQSSGFTGGYKETQLAPDVFRVTFRGNRYTSPERAQDFSMLRASELALQHGFTHFAVVDERRSTTAHSFTTSGHATTTGTAYVYGNQATYSGQTIYTPGQTHTFYKPRTGLVVQFFKTKPDGIFAFDAAFLQQSIKQTYKIK
ncbi:MAG: hypothetical protein HZA90_07090 [Verrucomicrobia bacterium]|nr:hypothetical protein [Verrucomicrobiota bacterium]